MIYPGSMTQYSKMAEAIIENLREIVTSVIKIETDYM